LKKNNLLLFMIGIVVGGGLMSILFGFTRGPGSLAKQRTTPTVPAMLPHLIALEPTGLPRARTQPPTLVPRTGTPTLAPMKVLSPTPTALSLRNGQQPEIIGLSAAGRPIELYTFGTGNDERMIVAGIHGGDEWNTVTLANQLIVYLNQNDHEVPDDTTLYILPNLNPDGERRAHNKYGRLNHNGVDLNRNFPVNWRQDWDRDGCWNALPSSGGTEPGSEPETQALMDFLGSHSIRALISYHSAALGVFPGGLPWDDASTRLAQAISEVSSYSFPPLDTGCAYSGTLADYAVSTGSAAVDLELTNHFDSDFDQNLAIMNVLLNFAP
jgi:predicted deacylase